MTSHSLIDRYQNSQFLCPQVTSQKCWYVITKSLGITFQKTNNLKLAAMRNSNLIFCASIDGNEI